MSITSSLSGVAAARLRINLVANKILAGANQGLREWGEETITLAKRRCPVDTGTLRSTGISTLANPLSSRNGNAELVLAFGGPAAKYAFAVHEGIRNGVPMNFHTGQAKFLESAIDERRPLLQVTVNDAIRSRLGGT